MDTKDKKQRLVGSVGATAQEKSLLFDPNTAFFGLSIVWRFTWSIVGISIMLAVYIALSSSLEWSLGFEGINKAIDIFKVPLAMLALLIPCVAVLATNHRSEQNKAAMALAKEQNEFANHYKHIEEFEKHCKSVAEYFDNEKYFINGRSLYHHVFELTPNKVGRLKKDIVDRAHNFSTLFIDAMETFKNRDLATSEVQSVIGKVAIAHKEFLSQFGNQIGVRSKFLGNMNDGYSLMIESKKIWFPDGETENLFERYLVTLKILNLALEFDFEYFSSMHGKINEIDRASSLVSSIVGGRVKDNLMVQQPFIHS
ncbi:MAG TPA: hypothetical protein DIW64_21740 [Cellvibrio sp.]|nr:hypothetical protein [Cellvibrio sp.]